MCLYLFVVTIYAVHKVEPPPNGTVTHLSLFSQTIRMSCSILMISYQV